jgi:hypothetical protein
MATSSNLMDPKTDSASHSLPLYITKCSESCPHQNNHDIDERIRGTVQGLGLFSGGNFRTLSLPWRVAIELYRGPTWRVRAARTSCRFEPCDTSLDQDNRRTYICRLAVDMQLMLSITSKASSSWRPWP